MNLDYRHVLAAIDFSPVSAAVIKKAGRIRSLDDARLTIVSVVEEIPVYSEPFGEFSVPVMDAGYLQDLRQITEERLHKFVDEHIGGADVSLVVLSGAPKLEIPRYAVENGVDLIVLGSHGHRGVLAMLGSTTDGIIHRAECDVLTVRAPAAGESRA